MSAPLFGIPDGLAANSAAAASAAAAAAQSTANTALANAATAEADAQSALSLIANLTTSVANGPSFLRLLMSWVPSNTAAGYISVGNVPGTATGTPAISRPANTSLITSRYGIKFTATTGTNRVAGFAANAALPQGMVMRGDTAGHGGFRMHATYAMSTSIAATAAFVGLAVAQTVTDGNANVQPTALLNCFGVGLITGSTNLDVISNDGGGSATSGANLGASFPGNDGVSIYQVFLYAPPNDASCYYTVIRENDGATVSGSIGSNLPTATQVLYPVAYGCTAGTSGAVVFYLYSLTLETYGW